MIYIIRHGQTDWNIEHRTQGQTDIALNTNGIKQAELITQKIANLKINNIISSDLKRAYMTAQIINKNFNKKIETDKRLREFCFGTLEGITRDKITQEIWNDFNSIRIILLIIWSIISALWCGCFNRIWKEFKGRLIL